MQMMREHCHLLVFWDIHGERSSATTTIELEKLITYTLVSLSSMQNHNSENIIKIIILLQQYLTG